jgi:7-cyano-7-deazaguanine synthase
MAMRKAVVRKGLELRVDSFQMHSCSDPEHECSACAGCDSCRLCLKGFREAGIEDPARTVVG